LRALVDYWTGVYDWRRQEEAINRFAQFRATVNGVGVHFIHERGVGEDPLPIILTHGYPDSILRFAKIIPTVEAFKQWMGSTSVPAAFAMFPKDISHPPREWASRFFNVQRWSAMPRGGHFAALEEPELLVDDIRRFFRPLRGDFAFTRR
jgi:Epoxide hydrolase N terminus